VSEVASSIMMFIPTFMKLRHFFRTLLKRTH